MERVKITSRNQITLPPAVRAKLNIKHGDYLQVDVVEDSIIMTPLLGRHTRRLRGLHREIWEGVDPVEYIEQERSFWDK